MATGWLLSGQQEHDFAGPLGPGERCAHGARDELVSSMPDIMWAGARKPSANERGGCLKAVRHQTFRPMTVFPNPVPVAR